MTNPATHSARPTRWPWWASISLLLVISLMGLSAAQAQDIKKSVKVAPGLYELVVSPKANRVYVASFGYVQERNASIVSLDADTLKQTARMDMAATPVFGLALNHETQLLYGTATLKGKIVVIDPAKQTVVAVIGSDDEDVESHLRALAIDETRNRIYATALGRDDTSSIWVVNGDTNTLENVIALDIPWVTGIAVAPAHQRLFFSSIKANQVGVINTATGKVEALWQSGGKGPINLAYDAASQRLFVANQKSGSLTVLDARNGELIASVKTGKGTLDVVYDQDRNRVYVTNRESGTLTIVDAGNYEVIKQLETGTYPQTVALNSATGQVYVSNKAKTLPSDAPEDAEPIKDPNGDTVTLITDSQ